MPSRCTGKYWAVSDQVRHINVRNVVLDSEGGEKSNPFPKTSICLSTLFKIYEGELKCAEKC
jgi:hypothetical protein